MFTLHEQLQRDSFAVTDLALCRVLLMNDKRFPWMILVPRLPDMREIIDLDASDRHRLMDEIAHVSEVMRLLYKPDKLNVAALGNKVPQLHVHVIARYARDAAWPKPVWGTQGEPYGDAAAQIQRLRQALLPSDA